MQTTSGAERLTARRFTDNTRAIRLAMELQAWECPRCRSNNPYVYSVRERLRYVRCRACGATGKVSA